MCVCVLNSSTIISSWKDLTKKYTAFSKFFLVYSINLCQVPSYIAAKNDLWKIIDCCIRGLVISFHLELPICVVIEMPFVRMCNSLYNKEDVRFKAYIGTMCDDLTSKWKSHVKLFTPWKFIHNMWWHCSW